MHGIIRIRNLHMSDLKSTEQHNKRLYDKENYPEHMDQDKEFVSYNFYGGSVEGESENFRQNQFSLKECVQKKLDDLQITPRKNSVVALEYVLAISPEAALELQKEVAKETILDDLTKFIREKHGNDSLVQLSYHFDESNNHAHVIVVPSSRKMKKWKNKNGSGEKEVNFLNAREVTGGKQKLRDLHTAFHNHCNKHVRRAEGKFKRGEDIRKSKKKYEERTNRVLGDLRKEVAKVKDLFVSGEITQEVAEKRIQEVENKVSEVKEDSREQKHQAVKIIKNAAKKKFDETTKKILPKSNIRTPAKNPKNKGKEM